MSAIPPISSSFPERGISSQKTTAAFFGREVRQNGQCRVIVPKTVFERVLSLPGSDKAVKTGYFLMSGADALASGSGEGCLKVIDLLRRNAREIINPVMELVGVFLKAGSHNVASALSVSSNIPGVSGITDVVGGGVKIVEDINKANVALNKRVLLKIAALCPSLSTPITYLEKRRKNAFGVLLNPEKQLQEVKKKKRPGGRMLSQPLDAPSKKSFRHKKPVKLAAHEVEALCQEAQRMTSSEISDAVYRALSSSEVLDVNKQERKISFSLQEIGQLQDILEKMRQKRPLLPQEKGQLAYCLWVDKNRAHSESALLLSEEFNNLDFSEKLQLFQIVCQHGVGFPRGGSPLMIRAADVTNHDEWEQFSDLDQKLIESLAITHYNKLPQQYKKLYQISKKQLQMISLESRRVVFDVISNLVNNASQGELKRQFEQLVQKFGNNIDLLLTSSEGLRDLVRFVQSSFSQNEQASIRVIMRQTLASYTCSYEEICQEIEKKVAEQKSIAEEIAATSKSGGPTEELQKTNDAFDVYIAALISAKDLYEEKSALLNSGQIENSSLETPAPKIQISDRGVQYDTKMVEAGIQKNIGSDQISAGGLKKTGEITGTVFEFVPKGIGLGSGAIMDALGKLHETKSGQILAYGEVYCTAWILNQLFLSNEGLTGINELLKAKFDYGLDDADRHIARIAQTVGTISTRVLPQLLDGLRSVVGVAQGAIVEKEIQASLSQLREGLMQACQSETKESAACVLRAASEDIGQLSKKITEAFAQVGAGADPEAIAKNIVEPYGAISSWWVWAGGALPGSEKLDQVRKVFKENPEIRKQLSTIMGYISKYKSIENVPVGSGVVSSIYTFLRQAPIIGSLMGVASNVLSGGLGLVGDALGGMQGVAKIADTASQASMGISMTAALAPGYARDAFRKMKGWVGGEGLVAKTASAVVFVGLPMYATAALIGSSGFIIAPLAYKFLIEPVATRGLGQYAQKPGSFWRSLGAISRGAGGAIGSGIYKVSDAAGTQAQRLYNKLRGQIDPQRRTNFLNLKSDVRGAELQKRIVESAFASTSCNKTLQEDLSKQINSFKQSLEKQFQGSGSELILKRELDAFGNAVLMSAKVFIEKKDVLQGMESAWNLLCGQLELLKNPRLKEAASQQWALTYPTVQKIYSSSVKAQMGDLWGQFVSETISDSDKTRLIDTVLRLYDTLTLQERLVLSPDQFQLLDPYVQKRVRRAVQKYGAEPIGRRLGNNIPLLVEQFNMLSEKEKATIDVPSLEEFHRLPSDEQREIVFAVIHSAAFQELDKKERKDESERSVQELFDLYQGAVSRDSFVFSNREYQKILKLVPKLSEFERAGVTPARLLEMGAKKMEHAYSIVEKYRPGAIPDWLKKKVPDSSSSVAQRHKIRYSEIIASLFRSLSPGEQEELLLFSQDELVSMNEDLQKAHAIKLLGTLQELQKSSGVIELYAAGKKEVYQEAIGELNWKIAENDLQSLRASVVKIFNSDLLSSEERAIFREAVAPVQMHKEGLKERLLRDFRAVEKEILETKTECSNLIAQTASKKEGLEAILRQSANASSVIQVELQKGIDKNEKKVEELQNKMFALLEQHTELQSLVEEVSGKSIESARTRGVEAVMQSEDAQKLRDMCYTVLSEPYEKKLEVFTKKVDAAATQEELNQLALEIQEELKTNLSSVEASLRSSKEEVRRLKSTLASAPDPQNVSGQIRKLKRHVIPRDAALAGIIQEIEQKAGALVAAKEEKIASEPEPIEQVPEGLKSLVQSSPRFWFFVWAGRIGKAVSRAIQALGRRITFVWNRVFPNR